MLNNRKVVCILSFLSSMNISASALTAQRQRLDIISENVSNIIEDQSDFKTEYNPEHPDADESGYVRLPNVNMLEETLDSMSATRSYQANVTVLNAVKLMAQKALEIGR